MEKFYNLDFKAIEFDGFKIEFLNEDFHKVKVKKLNKIVISQMRILSGEDRKELEKDIKRNFIEIE